MKLLAQKLLKFMQQEYERPSIEGDEYKQALILAIDAIKRLLTFW